MRKLYAESKKQGVYYRRELFGVEEGENEEELKELFRDEADPGERLIIDEEID